MDFPADAERGCGKTSWRVAWPGIVERGGIEGITRGVRHDGIVYLSSLGCNTMPRNATSATRIVKVRPRRRGAAVSGPDRCQELRPRPRVQVWPSSLGVTATPIVRWGS